MDDDFKDLPERWQIYLRAYVRGSSATAMAIYEKYRADAERYQFLKTLDDWIQFQGFLEVETEGLDAHIDKMRSEGPREGGESWRSKKNMNERLAAELARISESTYDDIQKVLAECPPGTGFIALILSAVRQAAEAAVDARDIASFDDTTYAPKTLHIIRSLETAENVAKVANELCSAIDLAEADIGGARPIKDILKDLGHALNAWDKVKGK